MLSAPTPPTEEDRQRALDGLGVLDTAAEAGFDALVQAAALICGVPIALVSLVDHDRQWFKANLGLPGVSQTPRDISFCGHAIDQDGLFEVQDTALDGRFADNPLVLNDPGIRFYAGAPLELDNGARVGTLCVIDRQPRQLTPTQRQALQQLSIAAAQALASRQQALAFADSEARFRALSDAAPLGVFATDAHGACTYTNSRWQAIYGLGGDEALGDGWSRTLHPDDRPAVFAEWQRTAALRQDFDMSFRVVHDSGQARHVRSVARAVVDSAGTTTGYVGSVEDITDKLNDQRALRKSETLLNRTGELANVGGWELDLASGELTWSAQTCLIHGLPPGHRPQLAEAINFYAPAARPVIQAAVERAMQEGTPWDLELPFIQAGGRAIWVRAVGLAEFEADKPVRLLGAFQDITEAVTQRRALEQAHQRIQLATDSGGVGIWDWDLLTDALTWDAWMYRLYGQPEGSTAGAYTLWSQHLHPQDRSAAETAVRLAVAGEREFDTEFRIVWADGSVRHLRAAARTERDEHGKALRMVGVNWDVTDLRRLSDAVAEQHELLRVTLQSIGDAVITTDAASRITWMNPVAERLTGWLSAEAISRPLTQVFHIVHQDTRAPAPDPVAVCLQQSAVAGLAHNTVLLSRSGVEFGIEDSAAPIRNGRGEILGAVLVFHDVTEQRRLSGEMTYRASHDALTGLVNRTEFEGRLRRALDKTREDGSEHAMMFVDLDQFKLVNDACGHSVGDQLLQQVAKMLGNIVRTRDTLARLGGDEFGVILEHCTSDQAQRVAQQICDCMDNFRFVHEDRRFRIGASVGLVPVDKRWASTANVVQAADAACSAAKEAGRNRVHTWFDTDQAMRARHGQTEWASRLEHALDEDRFVLYAQRIAHVTTPEPGLHAEILLRLTNPDGTLTLPGAFLPAAERFHLATRIDRWVLRHTIEALKGLADLTVVNTLCVNLSGQSVGDRAFHQHAIEVLRQAGPALCARLCLEVTETAAITNTVDAAAFIQQARALGVRVALDDFGAGASSFGYLKTLKVDMIKIDGQFIKDLIDDPLDDAAVRCFVDVARVLGLKTVAEFVDRPEILQRVRDIGIDYAQGYLLHKPQDLTLVLKQPSATAVHG